MNKKVDIGLWLLAITIIGAIAWGASHYISRFQRHLNAKVKISEIERELHVYYEKHGIYPENLSVFEKNPPGSEDSVESEVFEYDYNRFDDGFILRVNLPWQDEPVKISGSNGKSTKIFVDNIHLPDETEREEQKGQQER